MVMWTAEESARVLWCPIAGTPCVMDACLAWRGSATSEDGGEGYCAMLPGETVEDLGKFPQNGEDTMTTTYCEAALCPLTQGPCTGDQCRAWHAHNEKEGACTLEEFEIWQELDL